MTGATNDTTPPYIVDRRPGPGLATITDRRDGTTGLWSRALRGAVGRRVSGRPRLCANCGAAMPGPFYKPPQRIPRIADRLCVACVEGDWAGGR